MTASEMTQQAQALFFAQLPETADVEDMDVLAELACEFCDACPFAEHCNHHQMYYQCDVWEYSMGEDL